MFTDEQVALLRDVKISLIERDKEKTGGLVPRNRNRRVTGQRRPKEWRSKFKTKDILKEAPSSQVTSQAWFAPRVKAHRESAGYYVGMRWSPNPQKLEAHRRWSTYSNC